MTRLELQTQIKTLRDELENRHKTGAVKIATADGVPVPTKTLQDKLYSLIYKLSKLE
jgi:hypothetical protein